MTSYKMRRSRPIVQSKKKIRTGRLVKLLVKTLIDKPN